MAMGAFALLLRWMTWWQAVALAAAALAFNLFLLPRLRVNLYRPGDRERGVHRRGRGEEAAVDYPQVLDVVGPAPWVENACGGVDPGDDGPALVAVHADVEVLSEDGVIAR